MAIKSGSIGTMEPSMTRYSQFREQFSGLYSGEIQVIRNSTIYLRAILQETFGVANLKGRVEDLIYDVIGEGVIGLYKEILDFGIVDNDLNSLVEFLQYDIIQVFCLFTHTSDQEALYCLHRTNFHRFLLPFLRHPSQNMRLSVLKTLRPILDLPCCETILMEHLLSTWSDSLVMMEENVAVNAVMCIQALYRNHSSIAWFRLEPCLRLASKSLDICNDTISLHVLSLLNQLISHEGLKLAALSHDRLRLECLKFSEMNVAGNTTKISGLATLLTRESILSPYLPAKATIDSRLLGQIFASLSSLEPSIAFEAILLTQSVAKILPGHLGKLLDAGVIDALFRSLSNFHHYHRDNSDYYSHSILAILEILWDFLRIEGRSVYLMREVCLKKKGQIMPVPLLTSLSKIGDNEIAAYALEILRLAYYDIQ